MPKTKIMALRVLVVFCIASVLIGRLGWSADDRFGPILLVTVIWPIFLYEQVLPAITCYAPLILAAKYA